MFRGTPCISGSYYSSSVDYFKSFIKIFGVKNFWHHAKKRNFKKVDG